MSSAGNFAAYAMRMGISAMPFLFDNFEQAWAFMDGETQREISDDLLEYNVYVLGYFDNGFRCITTSERTGAINSVDDIKGLTIRTPENAVVMETMSQLGANPKVLAFSKLYEALQSGSFDAQENPIPIIYNSGFYKVQKYMAVTNHSYDAMPFVIRKDLWDMLMTSEQNILKNAALEAQNLNRSLVKAQTEEYISKLKDNGMIITYPNLNEFKYATSGVYDYFRPVFGDELISKVKTVSQ
jgi:tripartite ATP-independent transporter DctP family solute receptor